MQSIVRRANLLGCNNTDLTELDRLRSELAVVRGNGYASARCRSNTGGICLAAPIYGRRGKVLGTIGVTVPQERVKAESMDQLINAMLYCANDVTKKMHNAV